MLDYIADFANWATVSMGLNLNSKAGSAVSFFIEDSIEIFTVIYISFFLVSFVKTTIDAKKIKGFLEGKNRVFGYFVGLGLGAVTPFCLCSSIPIFLGLVSAEIPFGLAMTFLISAPLTNKIAALMLVATQNAGLKIAVIYAVLTCLISLLGGWLSDLLHIEKYLDKKPQEMMPKCHCNKCEHKNFKTTIAHSNLYTLKTIKEISLFVLIGLLIGALIQGYVPQEIFMKYLGKENFFAVPLAAISGIPIFSNHNNAIPLIQVLFIKGVPTGTVLAMLMSISVLCVPELMIFAKVLKGKILTFFVSFLIISFIISGYILNAIL